MKKETENFSNKDNSCGVASVVFGVLSVLISTIVPIYGIILGVLSLIFSSKQQDYYSNKWSKRGKVLAIVGIVLSIIFFLLAWYAITHPELLTQLGGYNVPY